MSAIKLTITMEHDGAEMNFSIGELDEHLIWNTEWKQKIDQMRDELLKPISSLDTIVKTEEIKLPGSSDVIALLNSLTI